jgi:DcaP outer membrane protein
MKVILSTLLFSALMLPGLTAQQTADGSSELPPGWWLIPKTQTKVKLGGYVKADLIHDFQPIGSPDFFDVSKIPTDGSEGQTTHLNAKETRLYLDVRTPSRVGELRMYVEGDFYGSSGGFRLRHGYVEIGGKWLAGQIWSNFMDESIIPNTLDFEKPAAYAFVRHPIIRYKHSLSDDVYIAVAVEEPSTNAQAPAEAGKFESPLPDLTARYRVTKPWGHMQLSGYAAYLKYSYTTEGSEDVTLFGGNLSGLFNVLNKKGKITYQAVYGLGAARYRGGLSAATDAEGNLQALPDLGFTVGYEHRWNKAFSSLVLYNYGSVDNTEGQPGSAIEDTKYFAVNTLWHFADNAFAGVEYLWGRRDDVNGDNGAASRLQFSVKYGF